MSALRGSQISAGMNTAPRPAIDWSAITNRQTGATNTIRPTASPAQSTTQRTPADSGSMVSILPYPFPASTTPTAPPTQTPYGIPQTMANWKPPAFDPVAFRQQMMARFQAMPWYQRLQNRGKK